MSTEPLPVHSLVNRCLLSSLLCSLSTARAEGLCARHQALGTRWGSEAHAASALLKKCGRREFWLNPEEQGSLAPQARHSILQGLFPPL